MSHNGGDRGNEAFVTYAQGRLKVFNAAKNFGFIQPVWKPEDAEGPPLRLAADEGIWFFGNHSLPQRAQPGLTLSFEVWENSDGKPQARGVKSSGDNAPAFEEPHRGGGSHGSGYGGGGSSGGCSGGYGIERSKGGGKGGRHPNAPRKIYPSVYISDVPVEFTEDTLRELHKTLGLNPEAIMGLKFLPFTEVSLGTGADETAKAVTPVTGSVILRYINEEAANAAVERLRGHPIRASNGSTKYLGARHAAPAKWMMERRQQEVGEALPPKPRESEQVQERIRGIVVRVSAAGYGVIKSEEFGEVMWRQYELPTNLRSMQLADPNKFQREAQSREDFLRLKEMEGLEVEAELHRQADGQLRATRVRPVSGVPSIASGVSDAAASTPARSARAAGVSSEVMPMPKDPTGTVCVRPVPLLWSAAELRERFEWYGNLVSATVSRRLATGPEGLADSETVWMLGVLQFDDVQNATEVVRLENGGSLDGQGSITVEHGLPSRSFGWCEGVVTRYAPETGVGVIRSPQVHADIFFEASAELQASGNDILGLRVDAEVDFGGDGMPQAKEVNVRPADPQGPEDADRHEKSRPKYEGGLVPGVMQPWGMPGMMPGMMGGQHEAYYKTQPCPYHRIGACQMGHGCFFAHSMDELRPAPEAMMMNQFAWMMGAKKEKKKKDKDRDRDRDRKRNPEERRRGGRQDTDDGGGELDEREERPLVDEWDRTSDRGVPPPEPDEYDYEEEPLQNESVPWHQLRSPPIPSYRSRSPYRNGRPSSAAERRLPPPPAPPPPQARRRSCGEDRRYPSRSPPRGGGGKGGARSGGDEWWSRHDAPPPPRRWSDTTSRDYGGHSQGGRGSYRGGEGSGGGSRKRTRVELDDADF